VLLDLSRWPEKPRRFSSRRFGNRFLELGLLNPSHSLPVMILPYAVAPYEDWHRQAWAAALVLLMIVWRRTSGLDSDAQQVRVIA